MIEIEFENLGRSHFHYRYLRRRETYQNTWLARGFDFSNADHMFSKTQTKGQQKEQALKAFASWRDLYNCDLTLFGQEDLYEAFEVRP